MLTVRHQHYFSQKLWWKKLLLWLTILLVWLHFGGVLWLSFMSGYGSPLALPDTLDLAVFCFFMTRQALSTPVQLLKLLCWWYVDHICAGLPVFPKIFLASCQSYFVQFKSSFFVCYCRFCLMYSTRQCTFRTWLTRLALDQHTELSTVSSFFSVMLPYITCLCADWFWLLFIRCDFQNKSTVSLWCWICRIMHAVNQKSITKPLKQELYFYRLVLWRYWVTKMAPNLVKVLLWQVPQVHLTCSKFWPFKQKLELLDAQPTAAIHLKIC